MNLNIHYPLDFAVGFHLAFSFIERIVNFAFAFALLIVELIDTISRRMIRSLAVCFASDWIRIVYIRPQRKPPDKITPANLPHSMIKLIVFCVASFANASHHHLIVDSFAEPASFKIIVESEFSFENQINPEPPRF